MKNNFRKWSRRKKAQRAFQRKMQDHVPGHKKGGLARAKSLALRFRERHGLSCGTKRYPVPKPGLAC